MIIPARVNSSAEPPRPAIRPSSAIAPAAPSSANSGRIQGVPASPVQKLSTAPSAAPGAIPNSPGSASGLRR